MSFIHWQYKAKFQILFGEKYVLIQLRILRLSIMICRGIDLRTSLASKLLRIKRCIFPYQPPASNKPPSLPTHSFYFHSQPDARNKKRYLIIPNLKSRWRINCVHETVSLIPRIVFFFWRTLVRNRAAHSETIFQLSIRDHQNIMNKDSY